MTMLTIGILFLLAGIALEVEEKFIFPERYKTPYFVKNRVFRAMRAWSLIVIGLFIIIFSI